MYFEESVTLDNESDRQTVWAVVDNLCLAINSKVDSLYVEDERWGLYSRLENKAKDTFVYPDPFHGILGDNVYKFVKELKEAVIESQVKRSDQGKTLQKYLAGEVWRSLYRPGFCADFSNRILL